MIPASEENELASITKPKASIPILWVMIGKIIINSDSQNSIKYWCLLYGCMNLLKIVSSLIDESSNLAYLNHNLNL
jgi:hypothetical protein